jgi:hypothetical protein
MSEDWYELIREDNNNLLQGDLAEDCPILYPPADINKVIEGEQPIEYGELDVIVLSQSCDLIAGKISIVQVCPFYTLEELEWIQNSNSKKEENKRKEALRRGNVNGYHLLNACDFDSFHEDFLAVDFRNTYGVNIDFLRKFIRDKNDRLRLKSPYREHLSQAFARHFMRVGLPADIPPFR